MLEVAVVPLNQNPLVVASKIFKDARHALRYHGAHVGGGGERMEAHSNSKCTKL